MSINAISRDQKPAAKSNPNRFLIFWRKAHTWIGLCVGIFLITLAITGIYLNHKDSFNEILGFKKPGKVNDTKSELRTESEKANISASVSVLTSLPLSLTDALALATNSLGDRAIEKVELKTDNGRWVYRVKADNGQEVILDAQTSSAMKKGEMRSPKPEKRDPTSLPSSPKPMDWGKAIKDLHTGKIGGDAGKLLIDLVAILLVMLTLSGVYLWIVPTLRKRKSARQRALAISGSCDNS